MTESRASSEQLVLLVSWEILAPVETGDQRERLVSLASREQEDCLAGKDSRELLDFRAPLDLKVGALM